MKHTQQGFIGIALVIIAALAIGGGVYYRHQYSVRLQEEIAERQTQAIEVDTQTIVKPTPAPTKKPVALTFEAKARAAAQKGECGKSGTIGTATKVQEEYEYALFTIENSATVNYCSVDIYAGTVTALSTRPLCDTNGQNCHGTGALPTPRKLYESFQQAPEPATFR